MENLYSPLYLALPTKSIVHVCISSQCAPMYIQLQSHVCWIVSNFMQICFFFLFVKTLNIITDEKWFRFLSLAVVSNRKFVFYCFFFRYFDEMSKKFICIELKLLQKTRKNTRTHLQEKNAKNFEGNNYFWIMVAFQRYKNALMFRILIFLNGVLSNFGFYCFCYCS